MAVARDTLAIEPDFLVGHLRLAVAYKHLGDARAAAEAERAVVLSGNDLIQLAQLGQIHAMQGRPAAARAVAGPVAGAGPDALCAATTWPWYTLLGERDEAFVWLRRAYEERYGPLVFLGSIRTSTRSAPTRAWRRSSPA